MQKSCDKEIKGWGLDKKYKYISDEVKNKIDGLDVVLPSMYTSIFSELAKAQHVDLDANEQQLSNEAIDEKLQQFYKLNEKTSKNVNQLSVSASKAVSAMEDQNTSLLAEVLAETKALREEVEALKNAVYEDPLTKVHNRKWFNDECLLEKESTFQRSGALALIDMNYFKSINDHLGHISGDKVLVFIANQLRRVGGEVVRYGGDEFMVVFSTEIGAEEVAKKLLVLRDVVMSQTLRVQKTTFKVSFAFGVVAFEAGDTLDNVIDAVDQQMFEDKQKIKRRYEPPFHRTGKALF